VEIAQTINGVLLEAIQFFNSEEGNKKLVEFFDDLSEVVKQIADLAPAAGKAILSLISIGAKLGRSILPEITSKMDELINKFNDFADSGGIEKSFEKAVAFAKQLIEATKTIFSIVQSVGTAFLEGFGSLIPSDGDQTKMDTFVDSLKKLQDFVENPLVQEGIKGIGIALFGLIAAVALAALGVGLLISTLAAIPDGVKKVNKSIEDLGNAIDDFLLGIGQSIVDFIGGVFSFVGDKFFDFINKIRDSFVKLPGTITTALSGLTSAVETAFRNAMDAGFSAVRTALTQITSAFGSVKNSIISTISSLPSALFNSGKEMVASLARGMLASLPSARNAASSIVGAVRNFFHSSPPKEGPMSGSGDVDRSGKILVDTFAKGMIQEIKVAASAADMLAATVARSLGLGETARFEPSFSGQDVTRPDLSNLRSVGTAKVGTTTNASTTNTSSRSSSAIINITAPSGDPNAIADRLRRLLETGAR
jgi:phage-related protein